MELSELLAKDIEAEREYDDGVQTQIKALTVGLAAVIELMRSKGLCTMAEFNAAVTTIEPLVEQRWQEAIKKAEADASKAQEAGNG
jgi:hypothetical protein